MKVKIYKYTFEIIEEDDGVNVYTSNDDNKMRIGLTDYISQKIYIHTKLSNEMKKITLAHELTHAFLFAFGYVGELTEEQVCDFVGNIHEDITEIIERYMR